MICQEKRIKGDLTDLMFLAPIEFLDLLLIVHEFLATVLKKWNAYWVFTVFQFICQIMFMCGILITTTFFFAHT